MSMDAKPVGIWIRVSTDFQVKDDSPEHHERRARMYAESRGWEVKEVYRLEAVSGKSVMDHPEAKRMLRDVKDRKITGLIFSKLARLARNTKELLEFSEIFRSQGADLISLSENIDTSSPAGRLFYTMIAAMAEWERQEIAERVAASVPVRAKMGKPLGGQAPYGYRWVDKELVIDSDEAPVRKLIYDLFLEHKRKRHVASQLNARGYRTRNGSPFSDTTVSRLLRDPTAKGMRRANYTKSLGDGKKWIEKPESEWVFTECPAIVSADVWDQCNSILDAQEVKREKPARKAVHLFAGKLVCSCGGKMYVPSRVKKYVCSACKKTSIATDDIEEIYYENLKSFLLTKDDMDTFLKRANEALRSKEEELQVLTREGEKVKADMDDLVKLYLKKQIPEDRFGEYFNPLDVQYKQIQNSIVEVQSQLDLLNMQMLDSDHVLASAETLYAQWQVLEPEGKRTIVEELTESIIVDADTIEIKYAYNPAISGNTPKEQRNLRGSCWRPA